MPESCENAKCIFHDGASPFAVNCTSSDAPEAETRAGQDLGGGAVVARTIR